MAHVRQQIRDALATALTGLATTGSNVEVSRGWPMEAADLPALVIRTESEETAPEAETQNAIYRIMAVMITAVARGTDTTIDDTLDTIAAEVEAAIGETNLSGLVKCLRLIASNFTYSVDGDRPVGRLEMEWSAEYRTPADDATTTA